MNRPTSDTSFRDMCEQLNTVLQNQLESSESNHELSGLLSAAKTDVFSGLIKQMIKDEFEKSISAEIDEAGNIAQQTWRIVAYNITKKISESPEMSNFIKNATSRVCTGSATGYTQELSEKVNNNTYCLSNPRQVQHLLSETSIDKPVVTRIQAFNSLLHSQISQMLFISRETRPKTWSLMRQILHKSLYEENPEIFNLSLKMHAKFVTSSHPQIITEGFISLAKGLSLYYLSDDMNSSIVVNGLSVENPTQCRVMQIIQLILFTIKQVSRNNFRSNEKLLEEIWETFFTLLDKNIDDATCIPPYAIVSTLDPHASWFAHALHGTYAQDKIFSILSTISLLQTITKQVVTPVSPEDVAKYASFLHSNRMFMAIVKCHRGRNLFPLATEIEDEPITLEQIYLQAVNNLNRYNTVEPQTKQGFTITEEMLKDGVPVMFKAGILKSDGPLMRAILEPLPSSVPQHTASMLQALVASSEGVQCLLGAHDTKTLLDFTAMVLKEQAACPLAIKISLLDTCGRIIGGYRSYYQYGESQLVPAVVGCFQQELSLTTNSVNPLNTALFRFLSHVGSTPLGTLSLSHHTDLLSYLQQMWSGDESNEARRCLLFSSLLRVNQFPLHSTLGSVVSVGNQRDRTSQGNSELYKFLKSSKGSPHDNNWHNQLRRAFKASGQQPTKSHVILELVDQLSRDISHATPRSRNDSTTVPSPETIEAATWIVSYGESNHLLQPGPMRHADNIVQLFTSYQQTNTGLDWFLAIAYLICGGHIDKCYTFLTKVSSLPTAQIVWPDKGSEQFTERSFEYGHQLEAIIQDELPYAAKGLQMGGVSWWLICRHWLDQCFINVVSWDQVCQWFIYNLISPSEYHVYYCVALLKQLQPVILRDVSNGGDLNQLLDRNVSGYRITDHIGFIDKLAKRYGNIKY